MTMFGEAPDLISRVRRGAVSIDEPNSPHPRQMSNSLCKRFLARPIPRAIVSATKSRRLFLVQALALAATTMVTVAEAKTPNREIDGFVESGHYGVKAIVPQWMRESPGRYWVAYVGFMASVILSLLFQWARGSAVPIIGTGAQELMLKIQSIVLAVCLMYVTIVNNTVGELMVTYMVGLCEMQIMIDTIRIRSDEHDDRVQSCFTLAFFAVMSILAVVLQDSFGPLNRLNLAYFVCLWFIDYFAVPDNYFERIGTEAGKMERRAASVAHAGFCLAAFNITGEVEDVPSEVSAAFFYTTLAMFAFSHSLPMFLPELHYLRQDCLVGSNLVLGFLLYRSLWNSSGSFSIFLASMVSNLLPVSAVFCLSWFLPKRPRKSENPDLRGRFGLFVFGQIVLFSLLLVVVGSNLVLYRSLWIFSVIFSVIKYNDDSLYNVTD